MRRSRLIKRSDVEISLRSSAGNHEASRQPGKPPSLTTPNPKKPSPCKTPCTFPNYMKSTSSSEARKEKINKVSSFSTTSRFHGVAKSLTKSASLKKVRTLTKVPSFKHTRTSTCSSTLKDSKFPPYLELKPGGTEAEGNSVLRICSYNYCSLNGHRHNSAPPLKRFMSSRRRALKSQNVSRPEVIFPRKGKSSESKTRGLADPSGDFFIEIYVPDKEVATQVSESLSDGPCSESDFQDYVELSQDGNLSEMKIIPKEEGNSLASVQNQSSFECDLEVESFAGVSLDEFSCENTDIEWEEGKFCTINDKGEVFIESDCSNDRDRAGFETGESFGGYLDEYPPYFHDEIVEFACFSYADSLPDSESTQTGEKGIEEPVMVEEKDEKNAEPHNEVAEENSSLAEEATIQPAKLEEDCIDKQCGYICDLIEEVIEDLDSYRDPVESDADESNVDNWAIAEIREENATESAMAEKEPSDGTIKDLPQITENVETSGAKEESCNANNDDRDGTDQSEDFIAGLKENEADNCVRTRSANSEDENDSKEIKLRSTENNIVEVKASEMGDINGRQEAEASPATRNKLQEPCKSSSNNGESESNQELLDSRNRLKRGIRCKKAFEEVEEEREFNPRGPNFLEIEPDPEAEKVDLRHQEMDERRNAEEWMLDLALQKTVNQLAPARKKKVALLVEAFEAVLPESKQ